eukprot:SAG31_NODE_10685_length_1109_cov_11.936258_1_plen_238_part_10
MLPCHGMQRRLLSSAPIPPTSQAGEPAWRKSAPPSTSCLWHAMLLVAALLGVLRLSASAPLHERRTAAPPSHGMQSRAVPQPTVDKHGAKCLNGAAPTMEIRLNRSSTQWILFLEGGGWCYGATANATIASCARRGGFSPNSVADSSASGVYASTVLDYGGVMGSSPDTNPDFFTWNAIFIHYCDGASMGSSRTDPIMVKDKDGKPAQLWMRGRNNFNAVIDDLMATQGMDKATEVIL